MADKNWSRWIKSSVGKYLKGIATTNGIAALIEGIDDRDSAFEEANNRVEIRVNGPFAQKLQGESRIWVDINVLATNHMEGAKKNAYTLDEQLGIYQEAMDGNIAIYRYGTGPDDDQQLLGCLSPRSGKGDSVRIIQFGQIDKVKRLTQGAVDARYVMYLDD